MNTERIHRLKYEVFRIVVIGVLVLCAVFALMMLMELRMLTGMRETVTNSSSLAEYYEIVEEAEENLSRYLNAGQNEDRIRCIESGRKLAKSNRQIRDIFDDPQFDDNDFLTQNYLSRYNQIVLKKDRTEEEGLPEEYVTCRKISAYIMENRDQLNELQTEITLQIYQKQYRLWVRQFILIGAAILLCGSYLLIFSDRKVYRLVEPITELTQQMQHFKNGEELSFAGCGTLVTETKIMQDTFKEMAGVIRNQMEQLVEKMRLDERVRILQIQNIQMKNSLNEAHLNLIQSLLSPHFLFNCLNTVSVMAHFEKAPKTRETSQLIACYLRDFHPPDRAGCIAGRRTAAYRRLYQDTESQIP